MLQSWAEAGMVTLPLLQRTAAFVRELSRNRELFSTATKGVGISRLFEPLPCWPGYWASRVQLVKSRIIVPRQS
jgi:hypothetical protein